MFPLELFGEPVWQRLTWTLLHFLWQGLAVAVVVAMVVHAWPTCHARNRYLIYLTALVVMAMCPLVTFLVVEVSEPTMVVEREEVIVEVVEKEEGGEPAAESVLPLEVESSLEHGVDEGPYDFTVPIDSEGLSSVDVPETPLVALSTPPVSVDVDPSPVPQSRLERTINAIRPYALSVWLGGVLLLAMRLSLSWLRVRWLAWGSGAISTDLTDTALRLSDCLGLRSLPQIRVSEKVREAIVVGLWRPLVLLPTSWLTQMTPEVLEAVIAHELAHVRRFDLWVNLLQRLLETLLFYHPAVWWLSGRVSVEREMCTDELAVAATHDRLGYATALEQLGLMRLGRTRPQLGAGIGGNRRVLLNRVGNILGLTASNQRARWWPVGLLALAVPLTIWLGSTNAIFPTADEAQAEEIEDASGGGRVHKAEVPVQLQTGRAVTADLSFDKKIDPSPPEPKDEPPTVGLTPDLFPHGFQFRRRYNSHWPNWSTSDVERNYAAAVAEVAQAEYNRAEAVNKKVPGTVPQSELRRLKLALQSAQLEVERTTVSPDDEDRIEPEARASESLAINMLPEKGDPNLWTLIWVGNEQVDKDALSERVAGLIEKSGQPKIDVRADRGIPHWEVVDVLKRLEAAGAKDVSVGTLRPDLDRLHDQAEAERASESLVIDIIQDKAAPDNPPSLWVGNEQVDKEVLRKRVDSQVRKYKLPKIELRIDKAVPHEHVVEIGNLLAAAGVSLVTWATLPPGFEPGDENVASQWLELDRRRAEDAVTDAQAQYDKCVEWSKNERYSAGASRDRMQERLQSKKVELRSAQLALKVARSMVSPNADNKMGRLVSIGRRAPDGRLTSVDYSRIELHLERRGYAQALQANKKHPGAVSPPRLKWLETGCRFHELQLERTKVSPDDEQAARKLHDIERRRAVAWADFRRFEYENAVERNERSPGSVEPRILRGSELRSRLRDLDVERATVWPDDEHAARKLRDIERRRAAAILDHIKYDYDAALEANRKAPGSVDPGNLKVLEHRLRSKELEIERLMIAPDDDAPGKLRDIDHRRAKVDADYAKFAYDHTLETDKRAPGTISPIELERKETALRLAELEVERTMVSPDDEDAAGKLHDIERRRAVAVEKLARHEYDLAVKNEKDTPFPNPFGGDDPEVKRRREAWQRAHLDLERTKAFPSKDRGETPAEPAADKKTLPTLEGPVRDKQEEPPGDVQAQLSAGIFHDGQQWLRVRASNGSADESASLESGNYPSEILVDGVAYRSTRTATGIHATRPREMSPKSRFIGSFAFPEAWVSVDGAKPLQRTPGNRTVRAILYPIDPETGDRGPRVLSNPIEIGADGRVVGSRDVRIRILGGEKKKPLAGLELTVTNDPHDNRVGLSATTEDDGGASFRLASGSYCVRFTSPRELPYLPFKTQAYVGQDYRLIEVDEPDKRTFDLTLADPCELVLRAVDVDTGKGIPGAVFALENLAGEVWAIPIVNETILDPLRTEARRKLDVDWNDKSQLTDKDGYLRRQVGPRHKGWTYWVSKCPDGYRHVDGNAKIDTSLGKKKAEHTFLLQREKTKPRTELKHHTA